MSGIVGPRLSTIPPSFNNDYSFQFDGTDEYVGLNSFTLNTDATWSVSFWANLDDFSYSYPEIFILKTDEATGLCVFLVTPTLTRA